ncbi:MAG TPA: NADH-quinone oxidoreductase subunit C [Candidatus Baltobacteraceae bacterium]|nr:NADH-quinone oxidoreductase subunit C [Candidatus Baltobacteraceae bacterium]
MSGPIAHSSIQTATERRVQEGARLAWIFGDRVGSDVVLHYVVDRDGKLHDESSAVYDSVRSISGQVPAADWYEREIAERFGVRFQGLTENRPLVKVVPAELLMRVESPEVSTVLYGPVRSGIVESVRWIVETAGEDFIDVYPSMFFKHRGLEERFIGAPIELAPFVAEHASGATASSHAAAFACAAESAMGIEVPSRARATRAVLVELERAHQHLDSLAKLAEDGSLAVGSAQVFAAKERVHRILCDATGNRFARGVICVGGTRFDVLERLRETCARDLDVAENHARTAVDRLINTQSFMDRLIGTGRLSRELVVRHGGVGPVARGSGVPCDVRTLDGYLFTPLAGEEALEDNGDAASRALVRVAELQRSYQLVRNALDADPGGPYAVPVELRDGSAIARIESPQGELLYFVRISDGALARVAVRSASYANWPLFVPSLPGNIFTDFSFIEHSFASSQSEVDR